MSAIFPPDPLFMWYNSPEDYEEAGLKFISPMLAKELEDEEKQDACLNSTDYYIEEKFDGTRATLHFCKEFIRCFSRRVSEKTGWLCENSDSVPHIRDIKIPELAGTILDGEMFIPNRPFKDVSSTLNCKWDKAVARQEEIGKIVFHAFDILYYKGIRVEMMPLHRRKVYLQKVIDAVKSQYIEMVDFQACGSAISTVPYEKTHGNLSEVFNRLGSKKDTYPNFYREMKSNGGNFHALSPRAFYEYLIATGGEGVIVKPINGKYLQGKRGWEYSKIKKFLTREAIIMGFTEPTDDYKGKFPTVEKWDYWEVIDPSLGKVKYDLSGLSSDKRAQFKSKWYPDRCRPVSKFYAKSWVGNVRFGVVITPEEIVRLPKSKKFNIEEVDIEGYDLLVLEVGECSGFDEETREYMTDHQSELLGKVIEVKANEIFKDTGKLRHPRFLRFREDKSPLECTFKDHISTDTI